MVLQKKDEAWEVYKEVKKDAHNLRGTHLNDLAQARINAGLEAAGSGVESMKKHEGQRRRARQIAAATKDIRRGGLNRVEVLEGEEWVEKASKEDMEVAHL